VTGAQWLHGWSSKKHSSTGVAAEATMFLVIYTLIWLAVLVVTSLFSFAVGRCVRKLPVIDYGLPWVMHRSAVPPQEHHGTMPGSGAGTAPRDDGWWRRPSAA
jgi:hypothetical protein